MASKGFRVVIVGGSIAGLTLALALEKNNIDFVVLEAYPEIAPQVGASIAVLPNGFRILDQLGCFEDILSKVNCTIDNFIVRDSDGKALIHVKDLDHHLVSRHGYPMIFFERRMVIEVLYQHIRQKDKDGEAFKGDILIGADGIHSTVGQQIWQAASEKNPELKKVQYRCLFGISNKVPGIGEDTLHHVTNVGSSSFAASGPNERTYWCLFFNTGTIHHGDDVPPYTDKDEAETVRQHGNDAITESVKFSDLYDRKIMSVCTPLHEGVLGTWHSQRCMVVGDAVHKFNPIVGLGGMSAMETCSALTNNLVALLASNPAASDISVSAIASVFSATQSSRAPRAAALVAASRDTQHRFAMETTFLKFINRYVYPTMGTDGTLRLLSEAYPGAVSVESLPLPEEKVRARNFPYEDELGWGR
ncbi:putative fad binding domain-containing protein [Neofusicoccum parvum UCRNP2]|uniref:Putative fad binding domain-containing protein n=1 Tax=Botryosphaeria parva (strain UCR-NP2) TaxID=1287680 RepID=R1FW79_BOTPV|nr:putative fad binding domain-containing protein [Neofusicoccum parvum UCRNP2]